MWVFSISPLNLILIGLLATEMVRQESLETHTQTDTHTNTHTHTHTHTNKQTESDTHPMSIDRVEPTEHQSLEIGRCTDPGVVVGFDAQ